jgi:hypothetical protein
MARADEEVSEELGRLIREIAGRDISASEKIQVLIARAGTIEGITFERLPHVPGTEGVFRGAEPAQGKLAPLLVILLNGRVFRGFEDALIPDPAGGSGLRILLTRLRELP